MLNPMAMKLSERIVNSSKLRTTVGTIAICSQYEYIKGWYGLREKAPKSQAHFWSSTHDPAGTDDGPILLAIMALGV